MGQKIIMQKMYNNTLRNSCSYIYFYISMFIYTFKVCLWGHGGRVVTLSPPTSEARVRSPAWPQVGKLVVACCWSAVYST